MVSAPLAPFSEAIRAIRIGLHLSNRLHAPQVVLVTSSLSREGKSAVAMLLAASSAGAHQRAVLVDCDLRGRAVSQHFGEPKPGLTELLAGTVDVKSVAIRDTATGCFVIPAGTTSQIPADLLASRRMDEMIDQLRKDFDFIVLDTPPLLSVVDPLTLAPRADRILLTIDSNGADCGNVGEELRLLRPDADRVAGMVFNKLPQKAIGTLSLWRLLLRGIGGGDRRPLTRRGGDPSHSMLVTRVASDWPVPSLMSWRSNTSRIDIQVVGHRARPAARSADGTAPSPPA